jgi:hypothetical protein
MATTAARDYYRRDGVRITHDPYAVGMAAKYGSPGATDPEGFDPYADAVGAGIYGGNVLYNKDGSVVIGAQYQDHNPRPGPVYARTGYSEMSAAVGAGPEAVASVLARDPSLRAEISTGGAQPLHTCGMSNRGQMSTEVLVKAGAELDAIDTYGYTPLMRMASNNLAVGAQVLVDAGADINFRTAGGETPLRVAQSSRALAVVAVLQKAGAK